MVLVDTSIWISHFREGNSHLKELLEEGSVVCHPFIIDELACGSLKNRKEIISLLKALPEVQTAESDEILQFIEGKRLFGTGLGFVDIHLLASSLLTKVLLWTADKSLQTAAAKLSIRHKC